MTRRRALITGVAGQDGVLLTNVLCGKGYQVFGLCRSADDPRLQHVSADPSLFTVVPADLTDRDSLVRAVEASSPDEVYNLAALSSVNSSWQTAELTSDVNAMGVVRLLEVLREVRGVDDFRFYQASTSEIFGRVRSSPQDETTELRPRSPYGVAKAFAHQMVEDYRQRHGLFAGAGILYNHESELRPPTFVVRKITRAVAQISLGLAETMSLGDLSARRDWGYAGDYVTAMWLMLQADEPADYVVATGEMHSVRDLLDVAFGCVGVTDWGPHVVIDPAFVRGAETTTLTGDASLARRDLGWKPTLNFEQLVERMVAWDLAALSAHAPDFPAGAGGRCG